jgi:AcrR family transcriptional regulator
MYIPPSWYLGYYGHNAAPATPKLHNVTVTVSSTDASADRLTKDQRREALLAKAAELVAANASDLSMDAVAEASGVSRPLLYKHFANRHELLAAVYRREAALLHQELSDAVVEATGIEGKFRALIHGALQAQRTRGAALSALRAAGGRPGDFPAVQAGRDQTTVGYFARVASREFGTEEKATRKTVSILLRTIEPVLAEWRLRPTPHHAHRLEQTYVDICMGALERLGPSR